MDRLGWRTKRGQAGGCPRCSTRGGVAPLGLPCRAPASSACFSLPSSKNHLNVNFFFSLLKSFSTRRNVSNNRGFLPFFSYLLHLAPLNVEVPVN